MTENKKMWLQVQKEMEPVTKNAKGYNYKYADLPAVWESLQGVLDKLKLAVVHEGTVENDKPYLSTYVYNEKGETIGTSKLPLEFAKAVNPQDLGAALTYFRRYNLLNLFNIIVEDDDAAKANAGSQNNGGNRKPQF